MGIVSPRMQKNPQQHKAKFNEVTLALNNYLALPMIKIIICMECIWLLQSSVATRSENQHKSAAKEEIAQNKSQIHGPLTQQIYYERNLILPILTP